MNDKRIVVSDGRVYIDPSPGFTPISRGAGSNSDRQRGIERDERGSGPTSADKIALGNAALKRSRRECRNIDRRKP